MRYPVLRFVPAFVLYLSCLAFPQSAPPQEPVSNGGDFSTLIHPTLKVPSGVILVKGVWSSASDSVTPLPEGTTVENGILTNLYFGMRYTLPAGWTKGYDGPPPSDTGRYVVAQLRAADPHKSPSSGSILITAQDMFLYTPACQQHTSANQLHERQSAG